MGWVCHDQDLASHPCQHSVRCAQRTCALVLSCYRPDQPQAAMDALNAAAASHRHSPPAIDLPE